MLTGPKILLVDDREENLLALEGILEGHPAKLLKAASGDEALELLLEHEDVALAVLDVQMPEMDGFQLAEIMRDSEQGRQIPIIFVTAGLHDQGRIFRGYESGAVDFLVKPIEPRILNSKVGVFLQLHLQKTRLAQQVSDLEEALRERRRMESEQRLLAELGAALTSLDYEETLRGTVDVVVRSLADCAQLFILAEDGRMLEVASASSDRAATVARSSTNAPLDRAHAHPAWEVVDARSSLIREPMDAAYDPHRSGPSPRSLLGVPLLVGDRCFGALLISSSSRVYEPGDLRLAEELGRRCALRIENAKLHQAAKRATQAREEVLGIVAHDLRHPLGNIFLQTALLRRPGERRDPRSRRPADTIERAAARMSRIIDDLLDVTRIEAGRFGLERTQLPAADLIDEVAEVHLGSVTAKSLALRCIAPEGSPAVWAERGHVLRVFDNLIGNALKCTPHGTISVGARSLEGEVLFWVSDTGCGIAKEELPHLFDRFWQGRTAARGSAGLGLAIVKGIVEAHGGRVWADSEFGAGSTFFFTLPIAGVQESAHASETTEPNDPHRDETVASGRRVLIAEDDRDAREALVKLLQGHGYDASAVANGREALDEIHRTSPPGLVLLDLTMPVMDGWAFLGERNEDPTLRQIPVIVVSGERDSAKRVAEVGARFLAKPVVPERLLEMIEDVELR